MRARLLTLVLFLAALGRPTPAAAADSLDRAHAAGRISSGTYALERARSLVRLDAVRARFGAVERPDPHDATLVLRDLRAAVPPLRGAERRAAERILARPSARGGDGLGDGWEEDAPHLRLCAAVLCVHWAGSGAAQPPPADLDGSGTPDWVERTLEALRRAWTDGRVFRFRAELR